MYKIRVKGALSREVGDGVRGEPVDAAPVRGERRPAPLGGDSHTGGHVVGDDGAQGAPAAIVRDNDILTVYDLTRGRIVRIDFDERRAFLGDKARLVRH